jgi:hypothetical protein
LKSKHSYIHPAFFFAFGIADKHAEHHHKQIDVLSVDFWVMFEM